MDYVVFTEYRILMVGNFRSFKASPLINANINQHGIGFHFGNCIFADDTGATSVRGTYRPDNDVTANNGLTQYNWLYNRRKHPAPHIILQATQSINRTIKYFYLCPQRNGRPGGKLAHSTRTQDYHFRWRYACYSPKHQSFPIEHIAKVFSGNQYRSCADDLTHRPPHRQRIPFVPQILIGEGRNLLLHERLKVVELHK